MKKVFKTVIFSFLLILGALLTPQSSFALGEVTYNGDTIDAPSTTNSGSVSDPNSVSTNVILKYSVPKVIAISVYDENGNLTHNPLLEGEFVSPPSSTFDVEISPTDIGTSVIDALSFEIHSVAFTNVGSINVLLSSASTVDADTIRLNNGSDFINVDLLSSVTVDSVTDPALFPLNTTVNFPVSTSTGRGRFTVVGSFDQSTLSPTMAPGNYSGTLTLTLAAP